jgi:hypothetical protein
VCKYTARSDCPQLAQIDATKGKMWPSVSSR